MKVLQVIPSIGPLRGGPSFVIRSMSEALAAQGCHVDVVTTDDNGPEKLSVPLGRPVVQNAVSYWYFPRQTRFYLVSWPLSQWLRKNLASYDVVHIHALFSFTVACAAWWARRYHVPYVVRPLGTLNRWGIQNRRPWLKQASLRLIEGRILSGAAAVHYTSDEERDEAGAVVPATRPVVIPNPVDVRSAGGRPSGWLKSRYPAAAGKTVILFLSRLDPKKGLDLLLAAFAQLRARIPNAVLVLGGAGNERFVQQLRRQAHDLDIERDIIWTGFLEGEAKKAVLSEADLFVLPSYSENFGVAAVEAMAAGLPLLVTTGVAIHREIAAAGAGLVVPCDAPALAAALEQMIHEPNLRSQLSRNGLSLARSYSPETIGERLIGLYSGITHDGNATLLSRPAAT